MTKQKNMHPYLKKLLAGGVVEWRALGEFFYLKNGYTPSKSKKEFWEHSTIPWFRMEDIRENGKILENSIQKIHKSAIKGNVFPANSIIISTSATIGEHALITVPYLANQRFTNLSLKEEYTNKFEIKFLFYYCFILDEWCANNTTTSSFASINMKELRKFQTPIPRLRRKRKLSRYLTISRSLQRAKNNITTTATNYSPSKKAPHSGKRWGEVANYQQPTRYIVQSANYNDKYETPVLTAGKTLILGCTNEIEGIYKATKNPVIIFDDFTTANKWSDFDFKVKSSAMKTITAVDEDICLLKYIYYWLNTLPNIGNNNDHTRQWISNFTNKNIPIPPLKEQQRIVDILDQFDTLTHSITEGLPREMQLREQQYAYYRDLLLNFKQ